MSSRDTVRMGALLQPDIRIQEEESELSAPQVSVLILRADRPNQSRLYSADLTISIDISQMKDTRV